MIEKLQVAEAMQEDTGKGRARLDSATRLKLNVQTGDILLLHGKHRTAVIIWRAHPDDEGKNLIRIDGLVRDNIGAKIGESVDVSKADVMQCEKLTLSPVIPSSQKLQFGSGLEGVLKRGLFKRPVMKNDTVIVPGIALIGRSLPFKVMDVKPDGICQINENTAVEILEQSNDVASIITNDDKLEEKIDVSCKFLQERINIKCNETIDKIVNNECKDLNQVRACLDDLNCLMILKHHESVIKDFRNNQNYESIYSIRQMVKDFD